MNRKRWIRILKMLHGIGIAALAFLIFLGTASAATLCVDKTGAGGCYTTIQNAVNSAMDGVDTIEVKPGTYAEGTALNVQKTLTIVSTTGPELTRISGSSDGVSVGSNRTVTIRGFTITGGNRGVYANGATLTLKNNIIIGIGSHGVYCQESSIYSCQLINNTILTSGGEGVYSDSCYACGNSIFTLVNNIIADSVNLSAETESCSYNTVGVLFNTTCTYTQTADPLFVNGGGCAVQAGSPTIDTGSNSPVDNDPDGTRNNQGACGGPGAAAFWPYPSGGPVITNLTVTPASVPQGGTITIQATGEVR